MILRVSSATMTQNKDKVGIKLGMWLFLYTEIMLFGGLFILYAAYYKQYAANFAESAQELNLVFGTINTFILLASSFTVATSITAIHKKAKRLSIILLLTSVSLGILFLINKYFEWSHKINAGIYPNSSLLNDGPPGSSIFFSLYYLITGLHGLHVFIGIVLLTVCTFMIAKDRIAPANYTMLENSGLYWHLVDLIWIFVFPLFYLVL